ncbi:MAG: class I SAM-dependent methyltransferase [Bryobacteraceae bacterium]|jgi:SAM-dependent methyltransferase
MPDHFAAKYEHRYTGQDEWRQLGAISKARNILEMCSEIPHQRILEIGAGEGAILNELSKANFGCELTALEVSKSAVDVICARKIPGVSRVVQYDGGRFPFETGQFDLAIASHVIEHVENPRALLYEAGRIAPYVFIEVPTEDNLRLKWNYVEDATGHINPYSPKTIRRLVQTCGFDVISQRLSHCTRSTYVFADPRLGSLKHSFKETALKVAPNISSLVFCYNASLLLKSPPPGEANGAA